MTRRLWKGPLRLARRSGRTHRTDPVVPASWLEPSQLDLWDGCHGTAQQQTPKEGRP